MLLSSMTKCANNFWSLIFISFLLLLKQESYKTSVHHQIEFMTSGLQILVENWINFKISIQMSKINRVHKKNRTDSDHSFMRLNALAPNSLELVILVWKKKSHCKTGNINTTGQHKQPNKSYWVLVNASKSVESLE